MQLVVRYWHTAFLEFDVDVDVDADVDADDEMHEVYEAYVRVEVLENEKNVELLLYIPRKTVEEVESNKDLLHDVTWAWDGVGVRFHKELATASSR